MDNKFEDAVKTSATEDNVFYCEMGADVGNICLEVGESCKRCPRYIRENKSQPD
jgi:hypothetical protein